MRIVFMGTPEFAVPSLERLVSAGYTPTAVVTAPDRPRGRGRRVHRSAVKAAAERLGIQTVLQPERVKDPAFAAQIRELNADLLVVVAFRILPPGVFQAARLGAFNLHGSLLPRYRGAAPIHRAVMAGDSETGVTTFFLKERVDTGDMILQKRMSIGPDETTGSVHDRMMELGAEAVLATVQQIEAGTVQEQPQDERLATAAPKVFREDGYIDWARPAQKVHNQIRGLSPVPGAWTTTPYGTLKVFLSRLADGSGAAGSILDSNDHLLVAGSSGAVELLEVQSEGGRRMTAAEFLRGRQLGIGTVLGESPKNTE